MSQNAASKSTVGTRRRLAVGCLLSVVAAGQSVASVATAAPIAAHGLSAPVTVTAGADGGEPLVRTSPDGKTVYVTSLQHVFVSHSQGRHFDEVVPQVTGRPPVTGDSTLDVAPDGRLFVGLINPSSFGTLAICTSADRAESFHCDPASVPAVNDRPWLLADSPNHSFVSSQAVAGLQTVLFQSEDAGAVYHPTSTEDAAPSGGIGPMVKGRQGRLFQPFLDLGIEGGKSDPEGNSVDELAAPLGVYEWKTGAPAGPAAVLSTPFLSSSGTVSMAATPDGTLYLVTEGVSRTASDGTILGKDIRVARSVDDGASWVVLPSLPGTTHGTAALSWITAGKNGHVGVVSYRTRAGSMASLNKGTWDLVWAETADSQTAHPTWRTTVVERNVHVGRICVTSGCPKPGRFAGDFINAWMDHADHAHLVWIRDSTASPEVRYASIG